MTSPVLVAAYGAKSAAVTSLSVPNVQAGDWLVAVQEVDYVATTALVSPTGSGSGTWSEIGGVAGNITNCNVKMRSWAKATTAAGTHTVTVSQGGNSSGNHLIVLHLRGVSGVDGTPTVGQGTSGTAFSSGATSPATPDALLVWAGAGIQFNGTLTISPPAGMTERDEEAFNQSAALSVATQVLTSAGSTGARSGTGSISASSGWCAKLFAISGLAVEKTTSDTAAATDTAAVAAAAQLDDPATAADATAVVRQSSVPDAAATTEQAAVTQLYTVPDAAAGVDTVDVTAIQYRPVVDDATADDAVSVVVPVLKTVTDAAGASEALSGAAGVAAPDSAAGVDLVAILRRSTVPDTAAADDPLDVLRASTVTDQATVSDPQPSVKRGSFVPDTATVVESIAILRFSSLADTATETEALRAGPFLLDSATVVDLVRVVDIPYTQPVILRQGPVYDVVVVARIPAASGPPTLLEVDPIEWSTLTLTDTLSKPQELSVTCLTDALPESVRQRLRSPARNATEIWLYRNGRIVFAGPLRGGKTASKSLTLEARGLLDYANAWTVMSDRRFAQEDQFAMVAWMFDQWQALEFGHHGIDTSQVGASGVLRDGTYLRAELHNVGKRSAELGERINGFDIEVDPASRQLQLWSPAKGVDRSSGEDAIVFDDRNITDGDILISLAIDDVATESLGTSGTSGSDQILYSESVNTELRALYGRSSVTATFYDIKEQATLDAHTGAARDARSDALIVPGPNLRITPDADVDAYEEGDTVAYTPSDVLGLIGSWRIRTRKITAASKSGEESASVEFV